MSTQRGLFDSEPPAPPRQRSYHVRSHQTVPEVQAGEARNRAQNDEILQAFRARPVERLTPWDVFAIFGGRYPVTSIRRALTDMSGEGGPLRHHPEDRRPSGPYNAVSSTWSLA